MKIFVLATHTEEGIEIDVYRTREQAENAFMRFLYECYQDFPDIPGQYDPLEIAVWLSERGETFSWTISEEEI